jgi:myotubularin-related protein 6/7/8
MPAHPQLCPTYSGLLFVPYGLPPAVLLGSARFRSRGRIPALSYRTQGGASLCRCSQPLTGLDHSNHSSETRPLKLFMDGQRVSAGIENRYERWASVLGQRCDGRIDN